MPTLINNIDVNKQGIYLSHHGAEELFMLPDTSKAETNNWQELDGLQVDFSTIEPTHPEVVIRYVVTSLSARDALEQQHKRESITLSPHGWARTFTLRKARPEGCKVYGKIGSELALEVSYRYELEDLPTDQVQGATVPLRGTDYLPGSSSYKLGGVDFEEYGVVVSRVYDTLLALDSHKEHTFTRGSREIQMQCCMIAPTWSALWTNRAALWTALQGELSLSTPAGTYKARYLSCATPRQITKDPMITFSLNIQLI